MTIQLAPRPKKRRRANETRDLTKPIQAALNRMPGVRVAQNSIGLVVAWHRRHDPTAHPFEAGLGSGSSDLVGGVTMPCSRCSSTDPDGKCVALLEHRQIARLFTIEVKRDAEAERGSRSESRRITVEDQARWGRAVRRIGGFYCIVHDLADAKAAVDRCRNGESQ